VEYRTKQFDSLALKILMKMLGPNEAFMNLHGYYVVGDAFDLPSVDIYLTNDTKVLRCRYAPAGKLGVGAN